MLYFGHRNNACLCALLWHEIDKPNHNSCAYMHFFSLTLEVDLERYQNKLQNHFIHVICIEGSKRAWF